jgi:oxygen-independent coproporphyrinogen-3 oxidase
MELLDEAQAAAEDLMLAMRTCDGAGPGLVEHARTAMGTGIVDETLARCERAGLLRRRDACWVPTQAGWLRGNELYGALWELAPQAVEECVIGV